MKMNCLKATIVYSIWLFTVFVTACSGATLRTLRKNEPDWDENRIVGAKIAALTGKKFPYFVSLGDCGGTLVAPDVVMTVRPSLYVSKMFVPIHAKAHTVSIRYCFRLDLRPLTAIP